MPSIQKNTEITMTGVSAVSSTETWAVGFFDPTPTKTLAFHLK